METQISSEKFPRIITELPGPKARKVIESDHRYISPSYTRPYPLVAKSGSGAIVEDVDGNRFLDFNAGIAVVATGHCHPRVVKAIQERASKVQLAGIDTEPWGERMVYIVSFKDPVLHPKLYIAADGTVLKEAQK